MRWLTALPFVLLTVICWGMYGPVLHKGQMAMDNSRLRAFLCVGMAYFLIAVVVPIVMLATSGERGTWSVTGIIWSSAAGAAGAIGALGIILAFQMGGSPVWVMPLVFGGAPVVNAFLSMYFSGAYSELRGAPMTMRFGLFVGGLVMVSIGAFLVLFFAPKGAPHPVSHAIEHRVESTQQAAERPL